MSGIAPGQNPPPAGQYVFPYTSNTGQGSGSVSQEQQRWTQTTIKQGLGAGSSAIGSWSNAQGMHNSVVKGRFVDIEDAMAADGNTLGNHENRITYLENGDQVAEYFSNDIWHKPVDNSSGSPVYFMHDYTFISVGGAGGGARSQPGGGSRPGWYGGAQGGYSSVDILESSAQVDTTVNVYIGAGGAGAPDNGSGSGINGTSGQNTYFQDTGGAFCIGGGGPGGTNAPQTKGTSNINDFTACGGQAWGYVGGEIQATNGGDGYLCLGGRGGTGGQGYSHPGGNGGSCPSGKIGPGAGGGGGGPYSPGGAGGFPGGGGGAGGPNGGYGDVNSAGPGGNGSIGRSLIISSPSS